MVIIRQDSPAAAYQDEEYTLFGKAMKSQDYVTTLIHQICGNGVRFAAAYKTDYANETVLLPYLYLI